MSKAIKITADTAGVKKSIADLARQLKKVGKDANPVSIFDSRERKFIKEGLKTALQDMQKTFQSGKSAISNLLKEQKKLKKNSSDELRIRKKITDQMVEQSKLAEEISSIKGAGGSPGGGGGGLVGGVFKKIAAALGGVAVGVGIRGNAKFVDSTSDRIRAQGLGMTEASLNEGSGEELARAGMSRRDLIQSRIQATALGSQEAGSTQATLQRGQFERTMGLETGQMTDVISMLRPSLGGDEANDTQMKLQASVFASGMEDALGPYLESMTGLLTEINQTGLVQTDQLINAFAGLSADGSRTPEQLATTFGGLDQSIRGSSGEQNAMLQQAFSNVGVGGDTIGGAQFAIESGGLLGMDRGEFEDRGFSPQMLDSMGGMGLFGGEGEGGGLETRSSGLLDIMRSFGNMEEGQSFGDMRDPSQIVSMANFSNSMFGTEGSQGLDTLKVLEDVESGVMTRDAGNAALEDIKAGKTPDSDRLDAINTSLSGSTDILRNIRDTSLDLLGQTTIIRTLFDGLVKGETMIADAGEQVSTAMFDSDAAGMGGGRNRNVEGGVSMDSLSSSMYTSIVDPTSTFDPEAARSGKRNRANQQSETSVSDDVEAGTYRAGLRLQKRKRSDTKKNSVNVQLQNVMPDGSIQNSTFNQ